MENKVKVFVSSITVSDCSNLSWGNDVGPFKEIDKTIKESIPDAYKPNTFLSFVQDRISTYGVFSIYYFRDKTEEEITAEKEYIARQEEDTLNCGRLQAKFLSEEHPGLNLKWD